MTEETNKPGEEQVSGETRPVTPEEPRANDGRILSQEEGNQDSPVKAWTSLEKPAEMPGKVVASPEKIKKDNSEKMKDLEKSTDLKEILTLGNELLSDQTSLFAVDHAKVLRTMSTALNNAGQQELSAQYLLKAEEVGASSDLRYKLDQLGKDLAHNNELLEKQQRQQ